MGTETRIGIATGLVIVVVASVYFFYGSDRSDGDLLVVSSARLDDVPAAQPGPVTRRNNPAPDTTRRPAAKPATSRANKPGRPAGRPGKVQPSFSDTAPTGAANRPVASPVKLLDPRVSPPRPAPGQPAVAEGPLVVAAHSNPPTRLRSEPSSILIEATKKNLERSPTDARPDPKADPKPQPEAQPEKAVAPNRPGPRPAPTVKATDNSGGNTPQPNPSVPATARKPSAGPAGVTRVKLAEKPGPPAGTLPARTLMPTQPPAPKQPVAVWPRRHTIAAGDTLSGISTHYYGTTQAVAHIIKANDRVKNPRNLKIGDVLVIPAPLAPVVAQASKDGTVPAAVKLTEPPAPRPAPTGGVKPAKTYRVQSGDSFYSIAKKLYGQPARWKDLYAANRVLVENTPAKLKPGMVLQIPE